MRCIFLSWVLILAACSPNSCQDFQNQGRAECRNMIERLSQVQNKEQLELALPGMKKRFDKIADLMIAARTYQLQHPDEERDSSFDNALFIKELNRIYQIEGGKEMMEEAQREALLKVDAFERQILAKKGSLLK